MARKDNVVVALDVGTSVVRVLVAEVHEHGLDVVGVGTARSQGLSKGTVVHIDATVESITRAVEEAQLMAGCPIRSVYAGITGGHIKGQNSHGIVAVRDREVSATDVRKVLDAARAVAIPMDRDIIHVIPQQYIVDDSHSGLNPVGMNGCRLEAKVHIVTAALTSAQNIIKACEQAELEVADISLHPLASAQAVLTKDEKDMGVALVDLGGGTTDIAIYLDGAVAHTAVLAVGGNHLTSDIAQGLRTPRQEAERLKQKFGCALTALVAPHEEMEVPSVGGRPQRRLSRQILSEIIEARTEEILLLVRRELELAGALDRLHSGIVLTGGGTELRGIIELAADIFDVDVRRGQPARVGGLTNVVGKSTYATAVGLALQAAEGKEDGQWSVEGEPGMYDRLRQRVSGWFQEMF